MEILDDIIKCKTCKGTFAINEYGFCIACFQQLINLDFVFHDDGKERKQVDGLGDITVGNMRFPVSLLVSSMLAGQVLRKMKLPPFTGIIRKKRRGRPRKRSWIKLS